MAKTVVGLFENETDAQTAVQGLSNIGISREYVDVSKGSKESFNAKSEKGDGNAVTRFFKSLFGDDNDDADRYSNVSSKGYSIVTVHAQSSDQAEEAADILDDCGAIDVDKIASQHGVSSDSNRMGGRQDIEDRGEKTLDEIDEKYEDGKRKVQREGDRFRSRIIEKPVDDDYRLRDL
jgi:hypothetical protein